MAWARVRARVCGESGAGHDGPNLIDNHLAERREDSPEGKNEHFGNGFWHLKFEI